MLEYEMLRGSESTAEAPTLVLLHGRGADRSDMAGLRAYLPAPWTLVVPDAPFPAAPWGYGPGRAWYRFLGRNQPEPDSFEASLSALDVFLDDLPALLGGRTGPLYLGGFSQGGTASVGWALAKAAGHLGEDPPEGTGERPGIINLSGFLADHPWTRPQPGALEGMRMFWGHGTRDANIPFELALEGRAALAATGVSLVARDYEMGHGIDGQELRDVIAFIEAGGEPDRGAHRKA